MRDGKAWESKLDVIAAAVRALGPRAGSYVATLQRWQTEADAILFHLRRNNPRPMIVCILGGTGTGKSTLVNRLLQADLSASSFRRTFTAGPVAVASAASNIPDKWLGIPHVVCPSTELPARGVSDSLIVVQATHELLNQIVVVDTPDLDGDQPIHHAQADRAFRWADAVIFLVTPEKYQMTELLPYYRLARRYGVTALSVMNKCESPEMLEDYRKLLAAEQQTSAVYSIARDSAAYQPPQDANLSTLRQNLSSLPNSAQPQRQAGLAMRIADLLGRLRDQILEPLRNQRRDVHAFVHALQAMETPPPGVDVNPITAQLERRLQQRSVLYLIGPGRVLDRVRQVPQLLVRLPRTLWDFALGSRSSASTPGNFLETARDVPDFAANLSDQFTIIQTRIEDVVRSSPQGQRWLTQDADAYAKTKIDPAEAGKIATEELEELKNWLQKRWNATPRDTVLLLKLLRHLPGGEKLTQWTEAAPYLLAIIVAAHHAFFGHVDLIILGGYTLATWLTERLSNEVAARARQTNRVIAQRFAKLAHQQIVKSIQWIESQAPTAAELAQIETQADNLQESLQQ
jgi:GTPase Era involved in 16S rRNA processing